MVVSEPTQYAYATLQSGLATAVIPPRSYRRLVTKVVWGSTVGGGAKLYRGTPAGAATLVVSAQNGRDNTYSTPFILYAGQGLFMQWANAPTPVSAAFFNADFMRASDNG